MANKLLLESVGPGGRAKKVFWFKTKTPLNCYWASHAGQRSGLRDRAASYRRVVDDVIYPAAGFFASFPAAGYIASSTIRGRRVTQLLDFIGESSTSVPRFRHILCQIYGPEPCQSRCQAVSGGYNLSRPPRRGRAWYDKIEQSNHTLIPSPSNRPAW